MINESDPLAGDPLARRLRSIHMHVPRVPAHPALANRGQIARWAPGPRAAAPVFWRKGRHRAGLIAAFAVASMVFATAAVNADTIARLTRQALNAAGLTSGQVSDMHGMGEMAGATATVNGGYGDDIATVLFVAFELPCKSGPCDVGIPSTTYTGPIPPNEGLLRPDPATLPYLVDQYGQHYYGSIGGLGVGAYPSFFEPLTGRARSGANLTLHVPIQSPKGRTEVVVPIGGTLVPHAAKALNPGPGITRTGVNYQVVKVEYSGSYLEVHTRLTGHLDSVITKYGVAGQGWPGVFLIDSRGDWVIPVTASGFPTLTDQIQDETRIFAVSKGTYRIVVAAAPSDQNAVPGSNWTSLAEWTVRTS
jgi:hypothetical protein